MTAEESQDPKPYDRRVVEKKSGSGRTNYCVEEFRGCDCPDCEADGHWMWRSGYLDKVQAQQAAER